MNKELEFAIQKLNELDSILETKVEYLNSLIKECKGKMRNTGLKYKKSGIKIAKEDIRRQLKDLKEQLKSYE